MLLDAGAGLEETDEFGMTPLLRACHQGNAELAEVLLERGADTESRGETDSTALLAAVAAARLATVRTLLKHGADPSARDGDERDALQAAEWHRHRFIGELLARHRGIKIRPLSGKASGVELAMAIQFDDLADARQMLDAEPELLMKPSSFGVKSATPLDVAAYFGRVSAAAMLLELGADPESSGDEFGTHPLHTAAKRGRAGVATLLIRAGADVNVRDRTEKRTPLHHAASMAAVDVVRVLLEAGADRRLKDEKGQTPLQVARARYLTSNPQGWEDPAELRRLNAGYAEVASLLTART